MADLAGRMLAQIVIKKYAENKKIKKVLGGTKMRDSDAYFQILNSSGAVKEGKAGYVLGSSREDNPYLKIQNRANGGRLLIDMERVRELDDLACQWDSGFSSAKMEAQQKNKK
jgi:hypothetical protein